MALVDFMSYALKDLADHISGDVLFPENPRFRFAVKQWNSVFDNKEPVAIVYCSNAEDVSLIIKWIAADAENRTFSVRSSARGGHLWSGYSVLDGGVVIDLSRLNTITVEKNQFARVGPGLEQGWANRAMAPYQRMFPTSGDCNQFAFGGFVQGGGFSLFARGKGIAADYMLEATVVLMDGSIVVAREDNEYSDLWWGLRGGGAGNFGIVTEMVLDTFPTHPQVLSIEAWWAMPDDPEDIAKILKAWAKVQKGNINPEFGGWLFLYPGERYEFKLGGIWAGDDVSKGWEFWDALKKDVGLPLLDKTSVLELSAHDAVDVHQLACAGRDFYGVIDARKASKEWSDDLMTTIAQEMHKHAKDPRAGYLYILFPHGGAVQSMDPKNKRSSYGKRDSPGDLLLGVVPKGAATDLGYYKSALEDYQARIFDKLFSVNYYPGHANSMGPPPDVKNAYYDFDNKPWLYERLQSLKQKYDPKNLLRSPVTVIPLKTEGEELP